MAKGQISKQDFAAAAEKPQKQTKEQPQRRDHTTSRNPFHLWKVTLYLAEITGEQNYVEWHWTLKLQQLEE
jgi:hypothetical protein